VLPASNQAKKRVMCGEWINGFSNSTRHYLLGDQVEMEELVKYLAHVSPHLKSLLQATDTKKRKASIMNTLLGDIQSLHPLATPLRRGTKSESSSSTADEPPRLDTEEKVHEFLKRCGVKAPEDVNTCLKAGLLKGHIKVPVELLKNKNPCAAFLKTVLKTGSCDGCCKTLKCTVGDALYQQLYGGWDYEEGSQLGAVICKNKKCGAGHYITGLCNGRIRFDNGKFHNHCICCPDFGVCMHDYRNQHCARCGDHYFSGFSGFTCPCLGKEEKRQSIFSYSESDSDDSGVLDPLVVTISDVPEQNKLWKGHLGSVLRRTVLRVEELEAENKNLQEKLVKSKKHSRK
jgi:hypothetical protein